MEKLLFIFTSNTISGIEKLLLSLLSNSQSLIKWGNQAIQEFFDVISPGFRG